MLNAWWDLRTPICYCVFALFFLKQILTMQNTASTKNSQQFLASQVSVLRRNKTTYSILQPCIFQLQRTPLYLVIIIQACLIFYHKLNDVLKTKKVALTLTLGDCAHCCYSPRLMSSLINGITCNIERTPWHSIFGNCDLRPGIYAHVLFEDLFQFYQDYFSSWLLFSLPSYFCTGNKFRRKLNLNY